jgi:tetratricopeptide (TPR) repeat protein
MNNRVMPSSLSFSFGRLLPCVLALVLTAGVPILARAQSSAEAPKKELSDKVTESIQDLTKLFEAQNWDAILTQVNKLLADAKPETFDTAYLSQLKVQALLNKQDYKGAIPPLETALTLSEKYGFFESRGNLELLWLLAQIYAQEAGQAKDPDSQRTYYAKAYSTVKRWLDLTPKSNPEAQFFAASILYNQAIQDGKTDKTLLEQAQAEAEKGLLLAIKPKENFYTLLAVIAQQLGDNPKAAEYLELLVRDYPTNKGYWTQLLGTYLIQEDKAFVRAINTIERAQQLGILNDKKDNFTLVALHLNAQQYPQAADLFEKGLRDGTLESEQKNWELLASSYQQMRKELKAVETLKEATKLFPKAGALDLQIGNIYYTLDKFDDALKFMKSAVTKSLEKAQQLQAYSYIAFLSLELKKLDEAKAAAEKALELDPNSKNTKDLLAAVNRDIEDRDLQLKASQTRINAPR